MAFLLKKKIHDRSNISLGLRLQLTKIEFDVENSSIFCGIFYLFNEVVFKRTDL